MSTLPVMSNQGRRPISLLCTEIGRGHPFYLDGIEDALAACGAGDRVRRASVFDVSRGLSRRAWEGVRAAYRFAGRGGFAAPLYHRFRGNARSYDDDSLVLRLLGRDARRWIDAAAGPVVVDHPALVGALAAGRAGATEKNGGRRLLWYIHGETVAPPESLVRRADRVFVPLDETARAFVEGGVDARRLRVTGICVESSLVAGADAAFDARQDRLGAKEGPLVFACYSSGAEPEAHVASIAGAAESLARGGHRPIVFAARGGRLARAVGGKVGVEIVAFDGRADLDRVTAAHFASFDLVVSPPHERSGWAFALGIPFLLVGPDLGPFAPRNRSRLLREGVAEELTAERAAGCTAFVGELRRAGRLRAMSERGRGLPIDGFRRAAATLLEETDA